MPQYRLEYLSPSSVDPYGSGKAAFFLADNDEEALERVRRRDIPGMDPGATHSELLRRIAIF